MRISDWSSDVCSSDLGRPAEGPADGGAAARRPVRHFRQRRVRYRGAVAGESRICGAAAELSWYRELRPCVPAGGGPGVDRKGVVWGKRGSVGGYLGGCRSMKKNIKRQLKIKEEK